MSGSISSSQIVYYGITEGTEKHGYIKKMCEIDQALDRETRSKNPKQVLKYAALLIDDDFQWLLTEHLAKLWHYRALPLAIIYIVSFWLYPHKSPYEGIINITSNENHEEYLR